MKIYHEIYKNTDMGIEAIDTILCKVENGNLSESLRAQREKLKKVRCDVSKNMDPDEIRDSEIGGFERGMLKSGITVKTALGCDDNKIASMMIEGTNMGLNSVIKNINAMREEGQEVPEIANELVKIYESHLTDLRQYL